MQENLIDGHGRSNLEEEEEEKTNGVQRPSHSENRRVFRRLRNTSEESDTPTICGRAFQSFGAELEKQCALASIVTP